MRLAIAVLGAEVFAIELGTPDDDASDDASDDGEGQADDKPADKAKAKAKPRIAFGFGAPKKSK